MAGDMSFIVEDKEVMAALFRLQVLLSPIGASSWLHATMGPYLAKRAKERFQSEGDDVTGPWAPLKEATVNIRESQGYGGEHPINRRTGELENWVVQGGWEAYPQGLGASLRYPRNKPTGTLRDKVSTAQRGGSRDGRGNTPPRPVLGVNEADMMFFQTALSLAVEEAIK